MKISSWNLNGYKSRHFGSKLVHEDFLNEIGHSDIVGLTETHIHKDILDSLRRERHIFSQVLSNISTPVRRISQVYRGDGYRK